MPVRNNATEQRPRLAWRQGDLRQLVLPGAVRPPKACRAARPSVDAGSLVRRPEPVQLGRELRRQLRAHELVARALPDAAGQERHCEYGVGGPGSRVRRLRWGLLAVPEESPCAAVAGLKGASSWCRPVTNRRLGPKGDVCSLQPAVLVLP